MAKKALVAVVVLALIILLAVVVGGTLLNRGSNSNPTDGQTLCLMRENMGFAF